jgi:hypothetical protein
MEDLAENGSGIQVADHFTIFFLDCLTSALKTKNGRPRTVADCWGLQLTEPGLGMSGNYTIFNSRPQTHLQNESKQQIAW